MSSKKQSTLKKIVESDLNLYDGIRLLDDENRSKALSTLVKEYNLKLTEEKQLKDIEFRKEQIKLDREKFNLSKKQFEFEKVMKFSSLELEKEKIAKELKLKEEELKSTKRKDRIAIITAVATGVGTILSASIAFYKAKKYVELTSIVHQHDYEDYKLESSLSKEMRNNLLNK